MTRLLRRMSCLRRWNALLEVALDRKRPTRKSIGRPRTTHCPGGHKRTLANTYIRSNGSQRCRVCEKRRVTLIQQPALG